MAILNLYAPLDTIKSASFLNISVTTYDDLLLTLLDEASRSIDRDCHRHFFCETKSLIIDGTNRLYLYLPDDLLSITTLGGDSEDDRTFDGETLVENTDFVAMCSPTKIAGYPKNVLFNLPNATYAFTSGTQFYQLAGSWGYGDGLRAAPWDSITITGTVATVDGTTLTISAVGSLKAGMTILIDSEQMFVSAVTSGASPTATIVRGVNGTTAATHTGKTIYAAAYPSRIAMATLARATALYRNLSASDFASERIGDYAYTRMTTEAQQARDIRQIASYNRVRFD